MNWELVLKVATIIISGLALVDKGYELIKKRRAQRRFTKKPLSSKWLTFLKAKITNLRVYPPNDLVLLSNFLIRTPRLIKKSL